MTPQHNAIKYGTDVLRGIGNAVGLGDLEEGTGRLGETLQPVLNVWDLPEWSFLRHERLGAQMGQTGAVVGEFSMFALNNSTGSGYLVIVETVRDMNTGARRLLQMASAADVASASLGASANGILRDRRPSVTNNPTIASTQQGSHTALIGQSIDQLEAITSLVDFVALPVILAPGDSLVVAGAAVNTSLSGGFWWRERPLLPQERTRTS